VAYSRQTLNFIYFIDIAESWNYGSLSLAITIVVVIIAVGITVIVRVIFLKRKKKQAIKNTKN